MTRTISSVLLIVFTMNILGYYGVIRGIQMQSDLSILQQIESAVPSDQEITFKVPISIPYLSNGADFERVDGEFEHNGMVYRLVKQKYINDTLHIVVRQDVQSEKIHQVLEDYVKTFSDNPGSSKTTNKQLGSWTKDYLVTSVVIENTHGGWEQITPAKQHQIFYTDQFHIDLTKPPCI